MSARCWRRSRKTYSFDAQTEQYVDMLEAGIVDPAKVVRVALQDAASVAGLMITTQAMVAETPKKKEAPATRAAAWAVWTIDEQHGAVAMRPRSRPRSDAGPRSRLPNVRIATSRATEMDVTGQLRLTSKLESGLNRAPARRRGSPPREGGDFLRVG